MAHEPTYTEQVLAHAATLAQQPGWAQWFTALDGTRTAIYITQELNVMREGGAQAHLDTSVLLRHALRRETAPGLLYLCRDGRVEMGNELVGHWTA